MKRENETNKSTQLFVFAKGEYTQKGIELARHLDVQFLSEEPERTDRNVLLVCDDEGIALTDGSQLLRGDFSNMEKRIKHNNLSGELLVKAVKIKSAPMPLHVLDATAGMGEDSFLLAAAGFHVHLYEKDKVIAALLKDSLDRAVRSDQLSDIVCRMTFTEGDSILAMLQHRESPDVILLDPMFPQRQKSALVKKKFQLLQQLESPCSDEKDLLLAAVKAQPKKIVIKRPAKGPYLAGIKPDYSLEGKSIRYDCIGINELSKNRLMQKLTSV